MTTSLTDGAAMATDDYYYLRYDVVEATVILQSDCDYAIARSPVAATGFDCKTGRFLSAKVRVTRRHT